MRDMHDGRLVLLAAVVCAIGTYASFALAHHAARASGAPRLRWGAISIVTSGCTAWATHFIVLLAFEPGMPAAFDPMLTASSLACAIMGIGAGVSISLRVRKRTLHFVAGLVVGSGVTTLHYVGQSAYLVQGIVTWNMWLVALSIVISLPIAGFAMIAASSRSARMRLAAPPLLLLSIALLHFCGMAAMTLRFDPAQRLPADAITPDAITPVVAGVSLLLIVLAVLGLRFEIAAKVRLKQDRRRLRELADVALEGLLICQGDIVVTANDSVESMAGYVAGALTGSYVSSLLPGLDVESMPEREEREIHLVRADGGKVPVRVLRREVALGHKVQTVIAIRDQRERLRTEAKIHELAYTDALTGIANRARFFDQLALHTASRRAADRPCAVMMIDLDRFKYVNDTLGHAAGDIILRMVAERLRSTLRESDVVARLGGDEFAIMQVAADEPEAAFALAARIVAVVESRPFMVNGQPIHLGASVGVALCPGDSEDPADLMQKADLALYAAKAEGRTTFCRYDVSLDEKMRARRAIEAGLRTAIAEGQLELHYQP